MDLNTWKTPSGRRINFSPRKADLKFWWTVLGCELVIWCSYTTWLLISSSITRSLDLNQYDISASQHQVGMILSETIKISHCHAGHLGTFLFTTQHLPILKKTAESRSGVKILTVSNLSSGMRTDHSQITTKSFRIVGIIHFPLSGIKLDSIQAFNQDFDLENPHFIR